MSEPRSPAAASERGALSIALPSLRCVRCTFCWVLHCAATVAPFLFGARVIFKVAFAARMDFLFHLICGAAAGWKSRFFEL